MSDIRARIVSSHSSTASTDTLVIAVESRTPGDALPASGWQVSISRSDKAPDPGWRAAVFAVGVSADKGTVSVQFGPGTAAGPLDAGSWWPFVDAGDAIEPAGVFVLRGIASSELILDGGAP